MVDRRYCGTMHNLIVPHPGRFRRGQEYPERVETQFKSKNYNGYPSREAWSAAFKEAEKRRKKERKQMKRLEILRKEARDVQDIARDHADAAMQVLVDVMNNENEVGSVRIAAAEKVIERGYGKATITTLNANLTASVKPSEINAGELDQRITAALDRIERLTAREVKTITSDERPSNVREYN